MRSSGGTWRAAVAAPTRKVPPHMISPDLLLAAASFLSQTGAASLLAQRLVCGGVSGSPHDAESQRRLVRRRRLQRRRRPIRAHAAAPARSGEQGAAAPPGCRSCRRSWVLLRDPPCPVRSCCCRGGLPDGGGAGT